LSIGRQASPPDFGVIDHVVMKECSGVNKLYSRGQRDMIGALIAAEFGGE
jgi:hypothetical protein